MSYKVEELKEKDVVGLKIRTTNENWQCIEDMGKLWSNFISNNISGSIDNTIGSASYGVYNNYESDLTKPYDYTVGHEVGKVESLSNQLISLTIPKGKYAKFSGKGDVKQIVGELWQKIWKTDLDRAYICDFEMYQNDSKDIDNQTIDIFISLK